MPYISDRHAPIPEEILFEGKNTEQRVDDPAHCFDAALPPSPDLRRDQINHRNPQLFQFFSHPKMEIGRVGQDGQIRGRWATTSAIPTTARSSARMISRSPAARKWAPAQPKKSVSGHRRRNS